MSNQQRWSALTDTRDEWGVLTDAQVWQEVPGQANASPLTATEGDPSFDEERLVFLGQQGKVLERKTRGQQVKHIHVWAPFVQQQEGLCDTRERVKKAKTH